MAKKNNTWPAHAPLLGFGVSNEPQLLLDKALLHADFGSVRK